jgi:hypothetical protein
MDLSDLPQSARDRIAAAEIEADSIVASASASAKQIVETYQFGEWDPLGIDRIIYGESDSVRAARRELSDGRDRAARHLFGAIAGEYLKAGELDMEGFNAKLNTIGDWTVHKYGIDRATLEQMKQECRKVALRKRAAALEVAEKSKGTIIGKLSAEALVRMEAETAAFLAEYLPKLEREANKRGPVHDAELLRELVIHQFNLVARECMAVCASVEEFESELHSDIARFVRYSLSQYRWLADPMRKELDAGFALFVMRANPWAEIPEKDRASVWHVGAITGEALTHTALKLRAEAWTRAAAGGFPKADKPGQSESSGAESPHTEAGPAVNGTNPPESGGKGRKRGPKSDHETASRVAEIVARVAPDGDWRPKLDDICEALDQAQIPYPPRWRRRDRSCDGWAAYDERANAVKAIEYRLELAKQRKKNTPETLS